MVYILSLFVMFGAVFLVLAYLVDFRIEFGRPAASERVRRPYLKGCGPFELPGTSEWGILFIHGISGSPAQMRPMAERLNADGHSCYGPVLPGHATHPDDLFNIKWEEWYRAVEEELRKVRGRHDKVMVIGFSLGAGLGLRLAASRPDEVDALVLISTPLFFFNRYLPTHYVLRMAWLISNVSRSWPKRFPQGPDGPEYLIYPYTPLDALFASRELAEDNRNVLSRVRAPLLMFHSLKDPCCKPDSARVVFSKAASERKRLVMFERAPHGVMHDGTEEQKALMLSHIREFLRS